MTDECALDALVPKLGCIATYNSSLDEMALNYAVLIVTTLSVFSTGPAWPRLCCVVFLVAFQVTLCLWLSCAGVSVVWASLASLIFVDARRSRGAPARLRLAVCASVVGVVVYYAVVSVALTTIAHLCAVALGFLLERVVLRRYRPKLGPANSDSEPPDLSSTLLGRECPPAGRRPGPGSL